MNVHNPVVDLEADGQSYHPIFAEAPKSVEFNKLRKRLLRQARQALDDFAMIKPGERWLVALSGGKDSAAADAAARFKWRGLLPVELLACNLDQGQPNFPKHILPDWLTANGMAHRIEYQDTYSIVTDKLPESSTYCSLCSRLRRGHLYRIARRRVFWRGAGASPRGHPRNLFMNLFHGGRLAAMPAKLLNDEGDLLVLRPLAYCAEADLAKFADGMRFPIIPCDLCGSQGYRATP
jgi:tRNA 2-thiocytidine biosynthesis protein TtcA